MARSLPSGDPITFGLSFLRHKIMIMMPNSETSDSNGYKDSLNRDPKDTSVAEKAGRESQGREPAKEGVGSQPWDLPSPGTP